MWSLGGKARRGLRVRGGAFDFLLHPRDNGFDDKATEQNYTIFEWGVTPFLSRERTRKNVGGEGEGDA